MMQVYDLVKYQDISCGEMPVESILVRNCWTSLENDQLDFRLLLPCAIVFSLINDAAWSRCE